MFSKLFCHTFLALGLNTCLNGVWNYHYIYQRDLTPFKCWIEVAFVTPWGYLRHFCTRDRYWHVAGYRSVRYLSLGKTVVSHLNMEVLQLLWCKILNLVRFCCSFISWVTVKTVVIVYRYERWQYSKKRATQTAFHEAMLFNPLAMNCGKALKTTSCNISLFL